MDVSDKDIERFWSKVEKKDSGCWEWTGYKTSDGYGQFRYKQKLYRAHRLSAIMLKNEDPIGKQVHHICINPACVNPDHLEVVTYHEHVKRTPKAKGYYALTEGRCKNGHTFDEENTYYTSVGARSCKQCKRDWGRKKWHERAHKISPLPGVTWSDYNQVWLVRLTYKRKEYYIAHCSDESEAIRLSISWSIFLRAPFLVSLLPASVAGNK